MLPATKTRGTLFPMLRPTMLMTNDFDRLLDQMMAPWTAGNTWVEKAFQAPLAMREDEAHLIVEIELPGVAREDVQVTVHQGVLHVVAERKTPEGDPKFHVNDRVYGRLERTVTLPEAVDEAHVDAELKDGMLHIRLAKRPEAQPRRIEVRG